MTSVENVQEGIVGIWEEPNENGYTLQIEFKENNEVRVIYSSDTFSEDKTGTYEVYTQKVDGATTYRVRLIDVNSLFFLSTMEVKELTPYKLYLHLYSTFYDIDLTYQFIRK